MRLIRSLGFKKDCRYAVAKVELIDVEEER